MEPSMMIKWSLTYCGLLLLVPDLEFPSSDNCYRTQWRRNIARYVMAGIKACQHAHSSWHLGSARVTALWKWLFTGTVAQQDIGHYTQGWQQDSLGFVQTFGQTYNDWIKFLAISFWIKLAILIKKKPAVNQWILRHLLMIDDGARIRSSRGPVAIALLAVVISWEAPSGHDHPSYSN